MCCDSISGQADPRRIINPSQMAIATQEIDDLSREISCPIGVVIPTYNRSEILLLCLQCLEKQTWTDFQVIVVDDGSTDDTPQAVKQFQKSSALEIEYLRQENAGPARARNLAIASLRAPVCLMIGDDILASPDLVFRHLELHQRRPEMRIAGLGLTRWNESDQTVTEFMRWLDESGLQFAYGDLLRGERPNWKHFYTSNLSLKTRLLQTNPFDESFSRYGMEDLELGYRLEQKYGLEVAFLPAAAAGHLHPTDFRRTCERMVQVGIATKHFDKLWPAANNYWRTSEPRVKMRDRLVNNRWLLSSLTNATDLLSRIWCPNPLIGKTLLAHFLRGYLAD